MIGNFFERVVEFFETIGSAGGQVIGQFPVLFAITFIGAIGGVSLLGVKLAKNALKAKVATKAKSLELKLRRQKTSEVVHNRSKYLKEYYKTRLKCANAKIANRYETMLDATRYTSKKLTPNEAKIAKLEAKIALAELNDKTKGISKDKAKLERLKLEQSKEVRLKTYVETMSYGGHNLKLTSNSISANNDELIKKYQLAIEGNGKELYNWSVEKEVYPKVMEIKNEKGELLYRLSDISSKRFDEFQTHILGELYSKTKEDEEARTPQVYTITSYDTQYKRKKAKVEETSISTPEEIRGYLNKKGLKKLLMPNELREADEKFIGIADPTAFLNKAKKLKQDSINYNERGTTAVRSRYLDGFYQKKVAEFNYGGADKYPVLTKVLIENNELLTAHLSSKSLLEITSTQLKAYATVMLFKRELEGIYTSKIDFATEYIHTYKEEQAVGSPYNPNIPTKIGVSSNSEGFYSSDGIYRSNFKKPGYVEAVFKIAEEMGIDIEVPMFIDTMVRLRDHQQPVPEFSKRLDELGIETKRGVSTSPMEVYVLQKPYLKENRAKRQRELAEKQRLADEKRLANEKRLAAKKEKSNENFTSSTTQTRTVTGFQKQAPIQTHQTPIGTIKTESNILKEEFERDIKDLAYQNYNDVKYYGIVISSSDEFGGFDIDLEIKTASRELFEKYMGKLLAEAYYKLKDTFGTNIGIPSVEINIFYLDKDGIPKRQLQSVNSLSDLKSYVVANYDAGDITQNL